MPSNDTPVFPGIVSKLSRGGLKSPYYWSTSMESSRSPTPRIAGTCLDEARVV